MLDRITRGLAKVFGTKSDKDLKILRPRVAQINKEYARLTSISDDDLRHKTIEFKEHISSQLIDIEEEMQNLRTQVANNPEMDIEEKDAIFTQVDKLEEKHDERLEEVLDDILPQAFAVIKETARRFTENQKLVVTTTDHDRMIAEERQGVIIEGDKAIWENKWTAAGTEITWNMVHYDVQLIGGMVLHAGKIAEMATGEGKTLVSTLPAYLNALVGKGVHLVTVNDYLAKRDSEWMAPLFEFHGMTIDCIDKHQPNSELRRKAYQADITYGTNNEFGFDYLRDNMSREVEELVQRKHHFAMVDEVDSVLIDDARTPLIISGPVARGNDQEEFEMLKPRVVRLLDAQRKYVQKQLVTAKRTLANGQDSEDGALALFRAYRGLPKSKPLIKFLGESGIRQKMQKIENYYLQDNSRMMPEADEPLYFTIDEKRNSIDLTEKGLNLITRTGEDENFFVLPDIGVELAKVDNNTELDAQQKLTEKDKVIGEYEAKAKRIHHLTQLLKAYTLFEKDIDYIIEEEKVKIVDEQTGRTMEGRRYSDGLHQALEAKESVKIEDATQTYATVTLQNYFRMYHKLSGMTGTAETEEGEFLEIYELDVVVIPTNKPIARDDREDQVYKTTREKFNAVVEEIQDLTSQGRPVLVGTTSVEISETLSRSLRMRKIDHQVLNAKQHAREADVVANAGLPGVVTIATNMAGRGTDIKLHPDSKAAGGLAIVGTERHESRRVDRQLRGRAGRQGDVGSSQFFVSLEDNLMRLFGSDKMAKIMDRLGLEEGEVIQHSMITKSIERAQKKVEENNFGSRKRLLEYDDVMNKQRNVIYKRRRNALHGERLSLDIMTMFYEVVEDLYDSYIADAKEFKMNALTNLGLELDHKEFEGRNRDEVVEELYDKAYGHYLAKNEALAKELNAGLLRIREQEGDRIKLVAVPFTDGKRRIDIPCELDTAIESEGRALMQSMEQNITLAIIDQLWKEHLRDMDDLRQQVSFSHLEQKDPLLIYKFEAFELFKDFQAYLNEEAISFLAKASIYVEQPTTSQAPPRPPVREAPRPTSTRSKRPAQTKRDKIQASKAEAQSALSTQSDNEKVAPTQKEEVTRPIVKTKLPNRNAKVSVRYPDGTIKRDVKFKKVEADFREGRCVLLNT